MLAGIDPELDKWKRTDGWMDEWTTPWCILPAACKRQQTLHLHFGWTCLSHVEGWCTGKDAVWSSPPARPPVVPAPEKKISFNSWVTEKLPKLSIKCSEFAKLIWKFTIRKLNGMDKKKKEKVISDQTSTQWTTKPWNRRKNAKKKKKKLICWVLKGN